MMTLVLLAEAACAAILLADRYCRAHYSMRDCGASAGIARETEMSIKQSCHDSMYLS